MHTQFSLVDQKWIPVADAGRVSLADIFTNQRLRALGGNPIQKIALLKLLLAIAQSACTPDDDTGHIALSREDLAEKCLAYLRQWESRFFLYGDAPFLQMPAIRACALQSYGAVAPEVSTGNTTVLTHGQMEHTLDDADKALLLVTQMGFALGGKKTDNSVVLTPGYTGKRNDKGKPSTGKPGPSLGFKGALHSFFLGESLLETLRLNLISREKIEGCGYYPGGLGTAPWEKMPEGEDCATAKALKSTLMGRLVPLSRFCLLTAEGLHYSEGIAHPDYKAGVADPTMAVNYSGKDPKTLWTNPSRRPWRELPALLSFIDHQSNGFRCLQLDKARIIALQDTFAIWSGGMQVSSNAGEQYASGGDDSVESTVWLSRDFINEKSFLRFTLEMNALNDLSKTLYSKVSNYYREHLVDGKAFADQATQLYWELCERDVQRLVDHCGTSDTARTVRHQLRYRFVDNVHLTFDQLCPNDSARQMEAWAKHRPSFTEYLTQETS